MASVYEKFVNGGRGTAESTLMLASFSGGHFFNIASDEVELDNGNVCAFPDPTKWTENDYFEAVAPTAKDEIILHLTAPKLYEEWTKTFQHEDNFYLGIGEVGRAYEVYKGDRFALAPECFDKDATPEVGKYVVVKDGSFQLTTSDSDKSSTNAFVGYILHEAANGKFVVFVMKNQA